MFNRHRYPRMLHPEAAIQPGAKLGRRLVWWGNLRHEHTFCYRHYLCGDQRVIGQEAFAESLLNAQPSGEGRCGEQSSAGE